MFTGIIEKLGKVKNITKDGTNLHFTISSGLESELYIDQSIAHNGVCLTVVEITEDNYVVTAIEESILKSNLQNWQVGTKVNLERCMTPDKRLDGHFVQGHVDTTSVCTNISSVDGSWYFTFRIPDGGYELIVDKGSICINGTSLTVILVDDHHFKVAIIPYTYQHTNFHTIQVGDQVNIEYDILGKYVNRIMKKRESSS